VQQIPSATQLVVTTVGRDAVLGFAPGDWVEITDDAHEFSGRPGKVGRIAPHGVDESTRTITLEDGLPPEFPVGVDPETRNVRVRRWDQQGAVRYADDTLLLQDVSDGKGVIPVSANGKGVALENGITVTFAMDPAGGGFRTGDYWLFAARTATTSMDILDRAPPRGIHHHFAKLALVTLPDGETDLRTLWPPETERGCDCTVCVSAESHKSGQLTLAQAVSQVRPTGGTICLGTGAFRLAEPLTISGAGSIRLRGQGWRTVLFADGPALRITDSAGVALENLTILSGEASSVSGGAVGVRNSLDVRLEDCIVGTLSGGDIGLAVGLSGYVLGFRAERCALLAATGIGSALSGKAQAVVTAALEVRHNLFWCAREGVRFDQFALHYANTVIRGNLFHECAKAGVMILGAVLQDSTLAVAENLLQVTGVGIVVGTDNARIDDNVIGFGLRSKSGEGIVIVPGLVPGPIGRCTINGNRITEAPSAAIALRAPLGSVTVAHNIVQGSGGAGLSMEGRAMAAQLTVEGNQFDLVAAADAGDDGAVAAVRLQAVTQALIDRNTIDRAALTARQASQRHAILAVGCTDVRIAGNRILDLGPVREAPGVTAGVEVTQPWNRMEVNDNEILRTSDSAAPLAVSDWIGIQVKPAPDKAAYAITGGLALALLKGQFLLLSHTSIWRFPHPVRGFIRIRGNTMQSRASRLPVVQVGGAETCLFSDNCAALKDNRGRSPTVVLQRAAVVASGNRMANDPECCPLQVDADSHMITILGNVTDAVGGPILVNGQALVDPPPTLNVRA
jgi:hypothetical protein